MQNEVKKFKNGNITIKYDGNSIDNLYHDEMFMNDLYFELIGAEWYLLDQNTQRAYYFVQDGQNILHYLEAILLNTKNYSIKIYPISKKESAEIFEIAQQQE